MEQNNDWVGVPLTGSVARALNPYRQPLAALRDAAELASYLLSERNGLLLVLRHAPMLAARSGFFADEDLGTPLCHAFSDLTDAFLSRLLALSCERAGLDPDAPPLALVATGGYGRRELCPFSDIDLTFVPLRDADARIDRVVRDMFMQIMDICIGKCGLKVGYAYRLLNDCGGLDHQTTTGLLDARLVMGSERLFIQFEDAFWAGFNAADFVFAKLAERRRVLARWGRLARVVEPQLKEGPGGLRDMQTAVWLTQAQGHLASARVRGARSLDVLQREQCLPPEDARGLGAAKETVLRVRNVLHALANAPRDTLARPQQEAVATRLGWGVMNADLEASPPVERFMADLYPRLALTRRVVENVMARVENSRMMLGIGLDCRRGKIVPANGALETDDPLWLLWACELAQKYDLAFSERLAQAARDLLAMRPRLSDMGAASQIWTRILSGRGDVYPTLQRMAELGILGWFVPEFGRVMDLIPYDPAHEYTVGQHTLNILGYLDALAFEEKEKGEREKEKGSGATLSPFSFSLSPSMPDEQWEEMRRVRQELGHPEQLMLAALLHDCGKGLGEGGHEKTGAGLALDVCRRLGWGEDATANVVFLIEHHLLMAQTSRLRDLTLEETIRDFARVVHDPERLDMLYLLTYADTRSVGEGVWTQLNGRFLQELWRRTASLLQGEPPSDDAGRLARARRRMAKDRTLENLPPALVAEHIQAMPPPYLLNQSMEHIALHIALVQRVRAGEVVVDFQDTERATYTELTVAAYDDPSPGLLAKIAGVLYAADLAGHSAQVFTRISDLDRIALDTLWVDFRGRQLSSGKRHEVSSWLRATIQGELSVEELLARRDARNTRFAPDPSAPQMSGGGTRVLAVHNDLSSTATIIEIEEPDAQGALFWTSQALSRLGWDIQSARVSLWHGAARASFYITGARHCTEDDIRRQLTDALRAPSL